MYTFFVILSSLLLFQKMLGQNYNRPVPPNVFPYEFVENQNPGSGYFLTVPMHLGSFLNQHAFGYKPMIIDHNGYVAWYATQSQPNSNDFKFYPQDQLYSITRAYNTHAEYYILDTTFQVIDTVKNTNGIQPDSHEIIRLSNGNYVIGGALDSVMDLSAFTFNGNPGSSSSTVIAYIIQEFDASHNLVFQWNSLDHIHPTEWYENYPYFPNNFDYCHGNAIEEDSDGHLLVSFRHLNSVYKIDHSTGNVIWRLGGKSNDFTFINDNGFSGQHDVRRLPDGNLSLFDNANSSPPPRKSRGVEYRIDTANMTATLEWEYIHSPSFFSLAMGNHHVTNNTYHLINFGFVRRPNPSFILTNENEDVLSEFYFKDSVLIYRAYYYPENLNLFRPQITCNNTGTSILLSAPFGYNSYVWSTGDTTQSITVNNPGIFQVWVNYGVGMAGSLPFEITDMNVCSANIIESNNQDELYLINVYDMLGRKIIEPEKGKFSIFQYSNGYAELKFIPYY